MTKLRFDWELTVILMTLAMGYGFWCGAGRALLTPPPRPLVAMPEMPKPPSHELLTTECIQGYWHISDKEIEQVCR